MRQKITALYQYFLSSSGVSTDSRNITRDCLFLALKGENFDGNNYALQAIEKGALLAVVDDQNLQHEEGCFFVSDVLHSLQELAIYHRNKLKIPVIGITGSNGKTTTKELLGRILEKKYNTFFTQGNLNNHIGVPLSVLSIGPDTEIAIIEMGANHPGEIAELCNISKPDFGIITNIGKAHLEGFGNYEGVIKAKNELYEFLAKKDGLVFVNSENPLLMDLSAEIPRITYGSQESSVLKGVVLERDPFLAVLLSLEAGNRKIRTHLIGAYNLANILAAACVGQYFHVDDHLICEALENFRPENNRSQYFKTSYNTLILDAYNANPTSMELAIKNFAELTDSKKMMILGDMRELGEDSITEHQKILELVLSLNLKDVSLVGHDFLVADREKKFLHFHDAEQAGSFFSQKKIINHTILIKGSRGIQLEKLVEAF